VKSYNQNVNLSNRSVSCSKKTRRITNSEYESKKIILSMESSDGLFTKGTILK